MGKRSVRIHPPERLTDKHNVDDFNCGEHSLNHWIKKIARRANNDTAAVFVVRAGGIQTGRVIGYYATAMGAVPLVSGGQLGKDAPPEIPVMLIGRLAVDEEYKGLGLGKDMMADALKRALATSRHVGVRAVIVHTLTDDLVTYYTDLGFEPLEPDSRTMFIRLSTLREAL